MEEIEVSLWAPFPAPSNRSWVALMQGLGRAKAPGLRVCGGGGFKRKLLLPRRPFQGRAGGRPLVAGRGALCFCSCFCLFLRLRLGLRLGLRLRLCLCICICSLPLPLPLLGNKGKSRGCLGPSRADKAARMGNARVSPASRANAGRRRDYCRDYSPDTSTRCTSARCCLSPAYFRVPPTGP